MLAALILMALVLCIGWVLCNSEWEEFKEEDEQDADNPYDGSNGI